ncbi:(d)CMP kinase [Brevibacillus massiliensis]|uniref:(d)CMP kinase n=1 Tax=Brevibacillus massiliensis TaxID=1118054 RepID=UPI000318AE1A|nr:(d)CMP kinase [Brevibacillus massiliensis]
MKIAIDGPAGAGKSTVARIVAARLGYIYIDTGAMYRALAWAVIRSGLAADDEEAVSKLLSQGTIELRRTDAGQEVFWNGQDITAEIRTPEVSNGSSIVASLGKVREQMLHLQRELARQGSVVMDGRDIGTHVLPDADVKIFLTASLEERAKRRVDELHAKGYDAEYETLLAELEERDRRDSERSVAPLRRAKDAHLVDTTGKSIEEVIDEILKICLRAGEHRR